MFDTRRGTVPRDTAILTANVVENANMADTVTETLTGKESAMSLAVMIEANTTEALLVSGIVAAVEEEKNSKSILDAVMMMIENGSVEGLLVMTSLVEDLEDLLEMRWTTGIVEAEASTVNPRVRLKGGRLLQQMPFPCR